MSAAIKDLLELPLLAATLFQVVTKLLKAQNRTLDEHARDCLAWRILPVDAELAGNELSS
jgi:hypothetical protein